MSETTTRRIDLDDLPNRMGALPRDRVGRPCSDGMCGCCPHPDGGRPWIGGRRRAGRCQPEQADAERGRESARAMAHWWRYEAGRPRDEDPTERAQAHGLLFDLEAPR